MRQCQNRRRKAMHTRQARHKETISPSVYTAVYMNVIGTTYDGYKSYDNYMIRTAQRDPPTAAAAHGDHVYPHAAHFSHLCVLRGTYTCSFESKGESLHAKRRKQIPESIILQKIQVCICCQPLFRTNRRHHQLLKPLQGSPKRLATQVS